MWIRSHSGRSCLKSLSSFRSAMRSRRWACRNKKWEGSFVHVYHGGTLGRHLRQPCAYSERTVLPERSRTVWRMAASTPFARSSFSSSLLLLEALVSAGLAVFFKSLSSSRRNMARRSCCDVSGECMPLLDTWAVGRRACGTCAPLATAALRSKSVCQPFASGTHCAAYTAAASTTKSRRGHFKNLKIMCVEINDRESKKMLQYLPTNHNVVCQQELCVTLPNPRHDCTAEVKRSALQDFRNFQLP